MAVGLCYVRKGKIELRKASGDHQARRGTVVISMSYAGVCGSDLNIYRGLLDDRVRPPMVIGHEGAGVVAEVGRDVVGIKEGDRVTVRPIVACDSCPACESGLDHLCHRFRLLGADLPGCFQTYWTVPSSTVRVLPPNVSLENGALVEPLAVACRAVDSIGKVVSTDRVLVIGGGPIGVLVALLCRIRGGSVLVSEPSPIRRLLSHDMGLDTVDPGSCDIGMKVRDWSHDGGADVVFETSGSEAALSSVTKLVRARGSIVVVSTFHRPVTINLLDCFVRETRLLLSRTYDHANFEEAIRLCQFGELPLDRFVTKVCTMDQAPDVIEHMSKMTRELKVLIRIA